MLITSNYFTGGLHFTNQFIKWYMPQYTMPIIMNPQHQILEMYMGINGKRLTPNEMKARGYTMMINEPHIIMSLPIGGPDGYYKVGQSAQIAMDHFVYHYCQMYQSVTFIGKRLCKMFWVLKSDWLSQIHMVTIWVTPLFCP